MCNKRILWIGCMDDDKEFELKCSKGHNLASAQVSQKNILQGIEEVTGLIFDSINGSIVPHYPIYKDKFVDQVIWSHKEGSYNISVGYKNIKYLNRIKCKKSMLKAANNWVKQRYKNEDLIVFAYSMRSASMAAACKIKKLIPNAKIYLIVTDLPKYMDLGESKLKTILKKIDWLQIKRMQNSFDGFILYAEKMAEYLNLPSEKWMLMEGLFDSDEMINKKDNNVKKRKAIMYSGKLDAEYGINMLLDSFMKIKYKECELWLTGSGNSEDYINKCAKKDDRIKFYGFLPSRKDVLEKQQEASILLNMRLPSEIASSYCFPSKLFEYMVTGTPVVSFKIQGIPSEYAKYIKFVEEDESSLTKILEDLLEIDEYKRKEIGDKAREFILTEKNKNKQCHRIVEFISKADR